MALVSGAAAAGERLALPAGKHAVGFTIVEFSSLEHFLQVSVWYPARASAPALRYRDYVLVSAREKSRAALSPAEEADALARYRAFLSSNGVSAGAIDEWLDETMAAARDAPPAGGRFPVVLIATGMGGAVQDEAALGELLASRGYVAATTPSPVRLGARMESEADVLPVAREQAHHLGMALALLRTRPYVDRSRVGVVGYSFGARSALLLCARSPEIRAFVSFDGGIGSSQAKGWLPASFDRGGFRTPILHVYEESDPAAPPDFALLDSLTRAPRRLVKVEGLGHLDFITYGLAAATLPGMAGAGAAARLAHIREAHDHALAFLDAHLRGGRSR